MRVQRIIYGAPPSNTPSGGVKVIYQHSQRLNELGIDSAVWHPSDESFQCTWFDNKINKVKSNDLIPETDLIVLPEIWASTYVPMLKKMGFRVAIYVQNCYYTHVNLDPNNSRAISDAYHKADIILSISNDTSQYLINILKVAPEKIVLQRYSINHDLFAPGDKKKIITYMPRKMADHSARVVAALNELIPADKWSIHAISNMNEHEVATALSHSIIFLAFSEFEGLPVPPVEAALCGNFVIGYDGQGGKEYWAAPNFERIEQGNIQYFVEKTLEKINQIDAGLIDVGQMNHGIRNLAEHFSRENETKLILDFVNKSFLLP